MNLGKAASLIALAIAAAACGQGNSDNVMSPEANALDPADVNAALGPEITNTPATTANDLNAAGNSTSANETTTNTTTE